MQNGSVFQNEAKKRTQVPLWNFVIVEAAKRFCGSILSTRTVFWREKRALVIEYFETTEMLARRNLVSG